jgi:hypothetical protein
LVTGGREGVNPRYVIQNVFLLKLVILLRGEIALMMEAVSIYETSAYFYKTTQPYVPEGCKFQDVYGFPQSV